MDALTVDDLVTGKAAEQLGQGIIPEPTRPNPGISETRQCQSCGRYARTWAQCIHFRKHGDLCRRCR